MVEDKKLFAVLIDGDNAQASLLEQMLNEVSKYGTAIIRRIYGDWTESEMNSWKETLHTHAFQPVQQFRYTIGKNATDSALIIDAMDILYTTEVTGFCIVSSDSDYTRLATRIRENNLFVMGIGRELTPRAFVNACNVFVVTENLVEQKSTIAKTHSNGTQSTTQPAKQLSKTKLKQLKKLFNTAFDVAVQEDGWANLGAFGSSLRQIDPSFDPRTFGHKQLSQLVQDHRELIEVRTSGSKTKPNYHVRVKT